VKPASAYTRLAEPGSPAPDPRVLVVAHRARSGDEPENTLAAVEATIARGVRAMEVDARITADGFVVACHDAEIAGMLVATTTLARLRQADPGLVTLRDVAELTNRCCLLDVDVKAPGYEEQVADSVAAWRCGDGDVVFTSFHDIVVGRLKALCPDTPAGLLLGVERPRRRVATRASELNPLRRLHACGADFAAPNHRLMRFGLARRLRRAGYPVWVWTVDDPRLAARLLADPAVSAVITDDALGVREVRDALAHDS
jgi:glycerophosphoryl diester phosphodiesterase